MQRASVLDANTDATNASEMLATPTPTKEQGPLHISQAYQTPASTKWPWFFYSSLELFWAFLCAAFHRCALVSHTWVGEGMRIGTVFRQHMDIVGAVVELELQSWRGRTSSKSVGQGLSVGQKQARRGIVWMGSSSQLS